MECMRNTFLAIYGLWLVVAAWQVTQHDESFLESSRKVGLVLLGLAIAAVAFGWPAASDTISGIKDRITVIGVLIAAYLVIWRLAYQRPHAIMIRLDIRVKESLKTAETKGPCMYIEIDVENVGARKVSTQSFDVQLTPLIGEEPQTETSIPPHEEISEILLQHGTLHGLVTVTPAASSQMCRVMEDKQELLTMDKGERLTFTCSKVIAPIGDAQATACRITVIFGHDFEGKPVSYCKTYVHVFKAFSVDRLS